MPPGVPGLNPPPMPGLVAQPSMSCMLMRAEQREGKIWMEDDKGSVWTLVEVLSQENTIVTVKHRDGKREKIDLVSSVTVIKEVYFVQ